MTKYEVWSETRNYETDEVLTVREVVRTDPKAAKEDAALLKSMGKRTWITEVSDPC